MQLLARGRPSRVAVAAAAVAAALALPAVLLLLAQQQHSRPAGEQTGGPGSVFVPDVPGAELARHWLHDYYLERQHRGAASRWPAAATLPSLSGCEARGVVPGADKPAPMPHASRKQQLGWPPQQQGGQHSKHLVLAAVGDSWGPGADKNR